MRRLQRLLFTSAEGGEGDESFKLSNDLIQLFSIGLKRVESRVWISIQHRPLKVLSLQDGALAPLWGLMLSRSTKGVLSHEFRE